MTNQIASCVIKMLFAYYKHKFIYLKLRLLNAKHAEDLVCSSERERQKILQRLVKVKRGVSGL